MAVPEAKPVISLTFDDERLGDIVGFVADPLCAV
jgi:hypothetical protein